MLSFGFQTLSASFWNSLSILIAIRFYLFLQTFWLRCHRHGPADSGVINIKPCPLYREILQEPWQESEVLGSSTVKAPVPPFQTAQHSEVPTFQ